MEMDFSSFRGLRVSCTGSLNISRADLKLGMEKAGATFTDAVSSKVNLLIVGAGGRNTSKYERATSPNLRNRITLLDEEAFYARVRSENNAMPAEPTAAELLKILETKPEDYGTW